MNQPRTPKPLDRELGTGSLWPILRESWEELLWPRVLGAARLGLRPGRLVLSFFAVVIAGVLLRAGLVIDQSMGGSPPGWEWAGYPGQGWMLLPWDAYVLLPLRLVVRGPGEMGLPVTTLLIAPLILVAWLVLFGAVSRMTAYEFSLGRRLGWTEALAFAMRRWLALLGAVAGPLVFVWVLALALAAAGWGLMRWPGLNILGGLLYGVNLLISFGAVMVLMGYALGHTLLIPAVVCEGADSIDAIQRAYSYVLARPLRLIIYILLAVLGTVVVGGILLLLAHWTIGVAAEGSAVLAGDRGWSMIRRGTAQALGFATRGEPLGGTWGAGAAMVRIWTLLVVVLAWSCLLSCGVAADTVVYLAIRRVADGQDIAELWIPGMVESNMAQAMAGRARAAAEQGTPQPGGGLPGTTDGSDLEES